MRISWVAAVCVAASVVLVAIAPLSAQKPAAAPVVPPNGVVVLDTRAVVQSSTRLKQAIETLKADYDAKAGDLRKESELGNQLTEKLRALPADSPERKKLEQEVLKMRADFELHGKRINDDTRDREAKAFYSMVRELQDEIKKYTAANDVQLILRMIPSPTNYSDPQALAEEIQNPIVYQRTVDITPTIIDSLNRRPGGSNATSRAPAQNKPVQR